MAHLALSRMMPAGWRLVWYPETWEGAYFVAFSERGLFKLAALIRWSEFAELRRPEEVVDLLLRRFVWPLMWLEEVQI